MIMNSNIKKILAIAVLTLSMFPSVTQAADLLAPKPLDPSKLSTTQALTPEAIAKYHCNDPLQADISACLLNPNQTLDSSVTKAVSHAVLEPAADLFMKSVANLMYWIMAGAGYLLGLVGILFNWIIVVTVFQYATYFGNSSGMLIAWGILRDIGNIMLLFGFIFMGVLMILDLHSFDAKKAIPRLLIFAVLLNFSLFASEAIVDVANVLSSSLYIQAGQSTLVSSASVSCPAAVLGQLGANCGQTNSVTSGGTQVGIAGVVINDTYLGTALNPTIPENLKIKDPGAQVIVYLATTIFILIVMVLLLAATIMFFTRAVMLTILLVVSPLGFAGMALPPFQARANDWMKQLISNAFFAPLFLLMMFVGLKVMEAARTAIGGGGTNLADALSNPGATTNLGGIFIVFGLTVGFMVAALSFAKSSGVAGAGFATGFAQKTVRRIAMAPVRVGAYGGGIAGRAVLGGGASLTSRFLDKKLGSWVAGDKGVGRQVLGKAIRFVKADEVAQSALGVVKDAKYGTGRSYEDRKKATKERDDHLAHVNEVEDKKKKLAEALAQPAGLDRDEKIERALQKMTQAELEETDYIKKGTKGIDDIARLLSSDRFDAIMGNEKVGAKSKEALLHTRFNDLKRNIDNGYTDKDEIRKYTNEDLIALAKYDPDTFNRLITGGDLGNTEDMLISTDQYDGIKKNKALGKIQRDNLNKNTKGGRLITTVSAGNPADISRIAGSMKGEIADLPVSVLIDPNVAKTFGKDQLASIQSKNKLDDVNKARILADIRRSGDRARIDAVNKWLLKNKNAGAYWTP